MADKTATEFNAIIERRDAQLKWLKKTQPECFAEQIHLNEGSQERVYWHYGYMVALTDVLRMFGISEQAPAPESHKESNDE